MEKQKKMRVYPVTWCIDCPAYTPLIVKDFIGGWCHELREKVKAPTIEQPYADNCPLDEATHYMTIADECGL